MAKKLRPTDAKALGLYEAAAENDMETARTLLAKGYCPNSEDELPSKFGTTPLMEGCFHGNADIVRMYIEHNADLNTQSGYGWTALHYAGQNIKHDCVALLLAAGANKELRNSKGKTAG